MYSLQTKKTSSKHLKASDDGPFVFFGKGRLEYGSASLDGVADGLRCKFRYLVVNQALVATVYSHNLPTVEDGSPCDALIAAFIPGASPPEVSTPTVEIFAIIN